MGQNASDVSILVVVDVEQRVAEDRWDLVTSALANTRAAKHVSLGLGEEAHGLWIVEVAGELTPLSSVVNVNVLLQPCCEGVGCLPGLDHTCDEVLLVPQRLVLEPEPGGLYSSQVVEDDIQTVLLAADSVLLAAV